MEEYPSDQEMMDFYNWLENDPEQKERIRRAEEISVARGLQFEEDSRPIVVELQRSGLPVESTADISSLSAENYERALPILLTHFAKNYPAAVMTALGQDLAVPGAAPYWDQLKRHWLEARSAAEEEGAAVALSACATASRYEELCEMVQPPNPATRSHLIEAVLRVGGAAGVEVVHSLLGNDDTKVEARARLMAQGDW